MNRFGVVLTFLLLVLLADSLFLPSPSHGVSPVECKRVLILLSNHPECPRMGGIHGAMKAVFAKAPFRVETRTEFLDGKYQRTEAYRALLAELYRRKYAGQRFDLIVASDNAAMEFLRRWRDRIFPGVPVVLCGVRGLTPEVMAEYPDFMGVAETVSAHDTVALMVRLFPGRCNVWVVSDDANFHRADHGRIVAAAADFAADFRFTFCRERDLGRVLSAMETLPEETLVLFAARLTDGAGRPLPVREAVGAVAAKRPFPIFALRDAAVGVGGLGGKVTSAAGQGRAAAEMAIRVLGGDGTGEEGVLRESPNRFLFDGAQLERFGVAEERLPEGSVVMNRSTGFYQANRGRVWAGIGVLLGLGALLLGAGAMSRGRGARDLRKREAYLASILDSIGDGVIVTDGEHGVTRMNAVAEELTGWPLAEAEGRHLAEIFRTLNATAREERPLPTLSVLDNGDTATLENNTVLQARDGGEVHIASSASPIRDGRGRRVGAVLVFRDVTERYRLEHEVRQAQKMESLGQLAGGVAHDFNNMLTGIIGYAEILGGRLSGDHEVVRYTDAIIRTGEKAADLTGKLLAFSRKGRIQVEPVDLHMVIGDAIGLLERSIDRRIVIECSLGARRVVVTGDPSRLQNAILNLGLNARDAMPDGGTLAFATENLYLDAAHCRDSSFDILPGDYIALSVSDTGCGISPAVMERIFEPFFTTKGRGRGTGLGLAAAYGTVKDHGGTLKVQSVVDGGSSFHIRLPLGSPPEERAPGKPSVGKGSGCILVVDDETIVRDTSVEILENAGYMTITARDGLEALEIFRREKNSISLVLLDMVMPRMGGRETYYALREIDPHVRVLLASGLSRSKEISALIREEGLTLVKKPFRRGELVREVAGALAPRA